MKRISKKQSRKLRAWAVTCKKRRGLLIIKYGYLPCEWGKERIVKGVGHHNDRDRNNETLENCRIICASHHRYITDNNVRDVPDRLGLKHPDAPPVLAGYSKGRAYSKEEQVGRNRRMSKLVS